MEEVECEGSIRYEAFPEMQGEVGASATESGDKVIIVGLDRAFCSVGAMHVWRNELELYPGIAYKLF